jgi:hypothetical protein
MQANNVDRFGKVIPPPSSPVQKLGRFLLAANLGFFIRLCRYGANDSMSRLRENYYKLDPFAPKPTAAEIERMELVKSQLAALEVVDAFDLVDPAMTITFDPRYQYDPGGLPDTQLLMVLALLRQQQPRVVLEIGTFCGSTAKAMALNAPEATIHTVDLPPDYDPNSDPASSIPKDDFHLIKYRRVGEAFRGDPRCSNVVQHFADSAHWDFTNAQGATFILIDGSHTYEYCKSDTEKALAVAGPGAMILWHDVDPGHPGVVAYVHELNGSGQKVILLKDTPLAMMKTIA